MRSIYTCWGSLPTLNAPPPPTLLKHILGVSHSSYDVDGNMETPSCWYKHPCLQWFRNLAETIPSSKWSHNTLVEAPFHSPHPLEPYTRGWTSFICCGWGYRNSIMVIQAPLFSMILQFTWNHFLFLSKKWGHNTLVEAPTQYGMPPPPLLNHTRYLTSFIFYGWG